MHSLALQTVWAGSSNPATCGACSTSRLSRKGLQARGLLLRAHLGHDRHLGGETIPWGAQIPHCSGEVLVLWVGSVSWPCSLLYHSISKCINNQARRILLVLGREHRDQHGTKECLGSPSHQHPWEERPQGEQPKKEKKTASRVVRHLHCLFHGLADQPFCNQITLLSNCKIN